MLVVLACMIISFAGIAKGQVYSNGYLFYHQVDGDKMPIIKFNGRTAIFKYGSYLHGATEAGVKDWLKIDPQIIEKEISEYDIHQREYQYNPDRSTPARDVYECKVHEAVWNGYGVTDMDNCYFIAVSKDLSSIITWKEYNCDGNVKAKLYCTKVEKDDYLPPSNTYDFLND